MAADLTGQEPESYIQALATVYPPGAYPSHIDIFGKGGFVPLNDPLGESATTDFINDRIIEQRRKVGMFVYLSDIKEYYRCSSITGENNWEKLYFSGRYFHGATAPTADDIQLGEKWFDTVVGSEYTYLPIAEGSTHLAWVDIDSIGSIPDGVGISGVNLYIDNTLVQGNTTSIGLTGGSNVTVAYSNGNYVISSSYEDTGITGFDLLSNNSLVSSGATSVGLSAGLNVSLAFADGNYVISSEPPLNYFHGVTAPTQGDNGSALIIGDKWFNTVAATEMTYLPINEEKTVFAWVDIDQTQGTLSENYVKKTGDNMSGTLTGTSASFTGLTTSNGFIGTLTGTSSSFTSLTASNGFIGTLTGTEASFNAFAEVSNSGSYENQPLLSVQKIGGNNVNNDGFYPGTTGFMNLPRLVLNNFSDNLWGWPKAIDFMTRPTSGAENSVIGWRIGDTYTSGGNSWLTFWGAPSQTFGNIGISAGPSGAGLTALGRFQYGVNREDTNGFYALKSFRMSDSPEFRDNEFVTKKFFQDNEYRVSDSTNGIAHFNLYLTYQTGDDNANTYEAWDTQSGRYTKSINTEIGPGITGFYSVNNYSYRSEYHDLTEEKVGFPKPWAVKVKKSFWRSSRNHDEPSPGPRFYPPHGNRSAAALETGGGPAYYVCDVQNFNTEKDIRIRYIGFKGTTDRGGPDGVSEGLSSDIVEYCYKPTLGVDFPAGGPDDGLARIKITTFTVGGYEVLGGDTFIVEVDIVPG